MNSRFLCLVVALLCAGGALLGLGAHSEDPSPAGSSLESGSRTQVAKGPVDEGHPSPPVAAKRPKRTTQHGETRVDDYAWLREKDSPEVLAYLKAENAYTDAFMKPTEALQGTLYREFLGRLKQTDQSAPYRKNGYFYYTRTEEGKQYEIHCRRKGTLDAPEEVILDMNVLAEDERFMGLGVFTVSDDGRLLACSLDNTGFREYTLYIKDLATGALGPERAATVRSAAWAADNRTLFYTVDDHAKRPYRLYRHRGGETGHDLVYEEKDEMFAIYVWRSRSGKFVFLGSESHTTSEVQYLPADRPEGGFTFIAPRKHGNEYSVDHHGDSAVHLMRGDDILGAKAGCNARAILPDSGRIVPGAQPAVEAGEAALRDAAAAREEAVRCARGVREAVGDQRLWHRPPHGGRRLAARQPTGSKPV